MPIVTTVGSNSVDPQLTRAIKNIVAQAKKQIENTGSITGFTAKFSATTGGGDPITISVSTLAASFWDKTAKPEDSILAFTVDENHPIFQGRSSGSTTTIKSADDVDKLSASLSDAVAVMTAPKTSVSYTKSEEAALLAQMERDGELPAAGPAGNPGKAAPAGFAALQEKQDASDKLVSALQDYLDSLKDSTHRTAAPGQEAEGKVEKTLKSLFLRVDFTV